MNRRSFLSTSAAALAAPRPAMIVGPLVELFTSQGCSSCPPADRVLARLHAEGRAVVLSEHVDYWNYLGWRDPFSQRVFTERQALYARQLRLDNIYTPQAVVNGSIEMVGSDEARLRRALAAPPAAAWTLLDWQRSGNKVLARVSFEALPEAWELWAAAAESAVRHPVPRGENAGRVLEHVSVARSLRSLGRWTPGQAAAANLDLPETVTSWRLVLWAQRPGGGPVRSAAAWDFA